MKMEFIVLVEFESWLAGGVDEDGIDVDEGVSWCCGAVGPDEGVVVIDVRPFPDAIRRACAGDKDDADVGTQGPRTLGEALEIGENFLGRNVGFEVVAAAVIDDDPRGVGRDDLIESIELVDRSRTAEGAVERGEGRHHFGHVGPLPEDAAADEKDSVLTRRRRTVGFSKNFELGLEARPTFSGFLRGRFGLRHPDERDGGDKQCGDEQGPERR